MVPNYITYLHFPFAYDIGGINLMNTYWPMWLGAAANAFNVILFKNSFDALSNSYVEAAKLDGSTDIGIFFRIVLPLSVPVIMTVAIFTFNGQFGNFFWPYLVLGNTKLEPVSVMLYKVTTMGQLQANDKVMILIFATIPSVIVYAIFSKKIVGGINLSGIKG